MYLKLNKTGYRLLSKKTAYAEWKLEKMPGRAQREYWTFSTTTNDKGGSGGEERTVGGGMMERQMPQEPIMI